MSSSNRVYLHTYNYVLRNTIFYSPNGVKSLLYFGLHRRQKICSSLAEETRETNVEPINKVCVVNRNDEYQSIQEHTEYFAMWIMKHSSKYFSNTLQITATVKQLHNNHNWLTVQSF